MFLLSERKLDETFPSNQFQTEGYKNFRLDRNYYWGGVCLFVHQDITARRVEYSLSNIENVWNSV